MILMGWKYSIVYRFSTRMAQTPSQLTKKCLYIYISKWRHHQPPPLHGCYHVACQEWDWFTHPHHSDLQQNIGMSFELDKCSKMVSKRYQVITIEGVGLRQQSRCSGQQIPSDSTPNEKLWGDRKEVSHRQIPTQSKTGPEELNGWNKIRVINTYRIPCQWSERQLI